MDVAEATLKSLLTPFLYRWKPTRYVVLINDTDQNILLDLPAGRVRLDARRSIKVTEETLNNPQVQTLIQQGKISVEGPNK